AQIWNFSNIIPVFSLVKVVGKITLLHVLETKRFWKLCESHREKTITVHETDATRFHVRDLCSRADHLLRFLHLRKTVASNKLCIVAGTVVRYCCHCELFTQSEHVTTEFTK